jgi:glycosyltransferase involved in cell wall biosynthesis
MTAVNKGLVMTKRVLAVCSFTPFPVHGGDSVRVVGLLKALSNYADLTVWCVDSLGGDAALLRRYLTQAEVVAFARDRPANSGRAANLHRYLQATRNGVPSWILKRQSASLHDSLLESQEEWDGVIALGEASAQYFDGFGGRWHWDKFNIQSVSLKDEFTLRTSPTVALREYVTLHATRRYEKKWSCHASTFSVTNDVEAARFLSVFGRVPCIVHSTVSYPYDIVRRPEPGRLLWLGSFGYRSNRVGLREFLEGSWADLAEDFELRVVGSKMTDHDRRWLASFANVNPIGFVDDLAEELSLAQLGIVPVWSGGGTKMKTLTMMAAGLPVVSTSVGLEGIPRNEGILKYFEVAEGADFASAVRMAALDSGLDLIGMRGRELVRAHFTEDGIGNQYLELIRNVLGG